MHSPFFYRRIALFAAVLATAALALAPLARSATPAAQDQYQGQQVPPGAPTQGAAGVVGSGGSNQGGGNQGVAGEQAHGGSGGTAGSEAQEGGGSTLPFTGYPMTALVWIVLGLVCAGIAIRLGSGAYLKLRGSEALRR